jgi:hypothetical protein
MTVAREIDVPETVRLENPRALGADVDSRRNRIGRRDLSSHVFEPRHRRPDLPRLAERTRLNHERVLLRTQTELDQQVGTVAADPGIWDLLPSLRGWKQLPQPLGCLPPDLR